MIKRLKSGQLGAIASMGRQFYAEGSLPGGFVTSVFLNTWQQFLSNGMGAVFALLKDGAAVGAIGGALYPDPNDGALVATEFFWFVDAENRGTRGGIGLFGAFESWAKGCGAKRITMVHLTGLMPEKLTRFYERNGFREVETHFVKEVV